MVEGTGASSWDWSSIDVYTRWAVEDQIKPQDWLIGVPFNKYSSIMDVSRVSKNAYDAVSLETGLSLYLVFTISTLK